MAEKNISVENQEVAELEEAKETSVENQEVAELENEVEESQEEVEKETTDKKKGKTDADSSFAEMRRKLQEQEKQNKLLEETLGLFFEGDDKVAQAKAYHDQKPIEEIKAEMEAEAKKQEAEEKAKNLEQQLLEYQLKELLANDLEELKAFDSSITSLDELGKDEFIDFRANGLTPLQAYYAIKAMNDKLKVEPPKEMGKLGNQEPPAKDYYTREEVKAMSQNEVKANFDKIRASMAKWK